MNKKIKLLIIFLMISIVVLIVTELTYKKNPASTLEIPSPDLPQLNINYVQPTVSSIVDLRDFSIPKQLPIYKAISIQSDKDKQAKQIASAFGIEDQYNGIGSQTKLIVSNDKNIYTWADNDKYLFYRLTNGNIEYTSDFKQSLISANDTKAKDILSSFLAANKLLPNDYQVTVEHLSFPDYATTEGNDFSMYRVVITPKIEGLPVMSYKNNGDAITVLLNRDFSFFKFDYIFSFLEKTNYMVNIIKPEQALSSVNNLKVKPSFITIITPHRNLLPEDLKIKHIDINKIQLVYYYDSNSSEGYTYPVYEISADIQMEPDLVGEAEFLVKAY